MNTAGNARSMSSKAAIRNALMSLLQEKELGKITVQDIVKRAKINAYLKSDATQC